MPMVATMKPYTLFVVDDDMPLNPRTDYDNLGTFIEFLCNKIDYEQIIEAINSLEEKYRYVLYYHFVMELSVPQTAKSLNQTLTTTKKQLVNE